VQGALGVPNINPGAFLSYEFYDQDVSWEVQEVCQACACHDRMSVFTPCFVRRSADVPVPCAYWATHYETKEVWFPGACRSPHVVYEGIVLTVCKIFSCTGSCSAQCAGTCFSHQRIIISDMLADQ
jgi:hypothetical protein